ncbi:MAG: ComEC/Rec2 family competence protein [Coriobacteriales bacterium]
MPGTNRSAPLRPSLGVLASAALAAWAAAFLGEELCWRAAEDGGSPVRVLLVCAVCAAVVAAALLIAALRCRSSMSRRRPAAPAERTRAPSRGVRSELALVLLLRRAVPSVAPALLAGCAVLLCSGFYWHALAQDAQTLQRMSDEGQLELELCSDAQTRSTGQVSSAVLRSGRHALSLRVVWPLDEQVPGAGHLVSARGSFQAPQADEAGRWCHQQGFAGTLRVESWSEAGYAPSLAGLAAPLRDASMRRISQLGGEAAGLLGGILLGNKTLYSGTELEQDFRCTGLAHLMAVSGTHLAVVSCLAGWVLGLLPLGRRLRSVLLGALLCSYVALTAFAPSALRACAMCVIGMGAAGFGRRHHAASALGACALLFLAIKPSLAFHLGFQLSVLCMAGLLGLAPLLEQWLAFCLPRRAGSLAQGLAATVAASVATLPVTVPLFCQLPLVSPLATLLASPLITAALGLGVPALLISCALPGPGGLLLAAAAAVAQACAQLVHLLARLPLACVPLDASAPWVGFVFLLAAVGLWALWPLPPRAGCAGAQPDSSSPRMLRAAMRAAVAAAFCLPVLLLMVLELGGTAGCTAALTGSSNSSAQVVMLDVGQGDAMLIRDRRAAVLVDTGEDGAMLLAALARQGVSRLDAVIISHCDKDHCGALGALRGVVEVGAVYCHSELTGLQEAASLLEDARRASGSQACGVDPGAQVRVGRFTLRLLAPAHARSGGNEDSLVWLLSFDADGDGVPEQRGLLTGDAEEAELEALCSQIGRVSFVKVGHHGSAGAFSARQLAVLRPRVALIGVGEGNRYGHPAFSTIALLRACGARVLRTDLHGDLTLSFEGASVGISTQRGENDAKTR